jgi:hypothetical protein
MKRELTMDELWVMIATILAFQKANELDRADYFREFFRDEKQLFRRIDAFQRDPANWDAIIAERSTAAAELGYGMTKQ